METGRWPWRRLSVNLSALVLFGVLQQIPLPGYVPPDDLFAVPIPLVALGIGPFVVGFLLVELWSLAVPGSRALRETTEGRGTLRKWGWRLGVLMAVQSAYTGATAINDLQIQYGLTAGADDHTGLLLISMLGGACVVAGLARWVDYAGVGSGIALLFAWNQVQGLSAELLRWRELGDPPPLMGALGLVVLAIATLRATAPAAPVRPVTAGILPVVVLVPLIGISALLLDNFGGGPGPDALQWAGLLALPLAYLVGHWAGRPAQRAAFRAELGLPAVVPDGRRGSLIYMTALGYAFALLWVNDMGRWSFVLDTAFLVAAVADLYEEAAFLRRHPKAKVIEVEGRVYAAEAIQEAKGAQGIPTYVRSLRQRSLFHGLAAFAPLVVFSASPEGSPEDAASPG